jgi:hypothetical protein
VTRSRIEKALGDSKRAEISSPPRPSTRSTRSESYSNQPDFFPTTSPGRSTPRYLTTFSFRRVFPLYPGDQPHAARTRCCSHLPSRTHATTQWYIVAHATGRALSAYLSGQLQLTSTEAAGRPTRNRQARSFSQQDGRMGGQLIGSIIHPREHVLGRSAQHDYRFPSPASLLLSLPALGSLFGAYHPSGDPEFNPAPLPHHPLTFPPRCPSRHPRPIPPRSPRYLACRASKSWNSHHEPYSRIFTPFVPMPTKEPHNDDHDDEQEHKVKHAKVTWILNYPYQGRSMLLECHVQKEHPTDLRVGLNDKREPERERLNQRLTNAISPSPITHHPTANGRTRPHRHYPQWRTLQ